MSRFGKLIRKLRVEKGLSLRMAANQAGLSKGYLCGIETAKLSPPSVKVIRKLAKIFGHDVREFVRLAWVDKAPAIIRQDAQRFLEWYQCQPPAFEKHAESSHGAADSSTTFPP